MNQIITIILLITLTLTLSVHSSRTFTANKLSHPNARCIDGSQPNYYFSEGKHSGKTKWYIFHQGGGFCTSLKNCYERSLTDLGSTNDDEDEKKISGNALSDKKENNAMMYDWNFVYVRYCDGGLYVGGNMSESVYDGKVMYFRGRFIVEAVLDDLIDRRGIAEATDVVIGGCSAGAMGTYLNSNYYFDRIKAVAVHDDIKIRSLPDSGFFPDYQSEYSNFQSRIHFSYKLHNMSYGAVRECVYDSENVMNCLFPQYIVPYLKVPFFGLQSRFDTWQIYSELGTSDVKLVNEYGKDVVTPLLKGLLESYPEHGMMLDSCEHHCGNFWNAIEVNGTTQRKAFEKWYLENQTNVFLLQNEDYNCYDCCNDGRLSPLAVVLIIVSSVILVSGIVVVIVVLSRPKACYGTKSEY
eukprot:TRINITY_DN10686_c0_g1_i1.p1 TRINITY_DN10686_c0_g1~~TRINITY_DN10686_c0_g1_i1.p1  ORF type:complete len:410 (+),score=64.63 TRINITY_DN10686_c0_g1_i1:144-1373(+)